MSALGGDIFSSADLLKTVQASRMVYPNIRRTSMKTLGLLPCGILMWMVAVLGGTAEVEGQPLGLPLVPIAADNPLTPEKPPLERSSSTTPDSAGRAK